ncbi:MAG: hypothetical protein DDT32_01443 [Syntrophomonadaceae bacterium]|nr:hypothetical protein [Bacillota bacterium]
MRQTTDLILHVRKSADMNHHGAMLSIIPSDIADSINEQEIHYSLFHARRQIINDKILFVIKRKEDIHLLRMEFLQRISELSLFSEYVVCTDVVRRRSQ